MHSVDRNIDTDLVSAFLPVGSKIFAASCYFGILKYSESTAKWELSGRPTPGEAGIASLYSLHDSLLLAGTILGVFRSTDSGLTWFKSDNSALPDLSTGWYVSQFAQKGEYLFAACHGVFRSADYGISWQEVSGGLPTESSVTGIAAFGSKLFAGTDWYGLYCSIDDGASWSVTSLQSDISAVTIHDSLIFAGTSYNGLFVSKDGITWDSSNDGLQNRTVFQFTSSGQNFFAATDSGVFLSTNRGRTWVAVSDGFPTDFPLPRECWIMSLGVSKGYLYVGLWRKGIWRRPLSEMIARSAVPEQPVASEREAQANPNPFSDKTTIRFTTAERGPARVSIVNMLAVEVACLFDGELAAGEHVFVWSNSGGLPDGTYDCIVRSNNQVERVALILAR
ncbi:MAG: hypothetical protein Q8922_03450 [Bacteroidota bacterium]|nr:hypothetical protein [Bacteroidota bacterium]MDP4242214.1 hypothetical protein [Bacteroidota bacterium]MDP4286969.1 hypothetical protein [Bacteroidota bacterium]